MLSLAADKTDPRILNYLGYSHRKQGRVLVGLGYYQEALRNDPDYTLVREYMGEAHLQLGDVASAKTQLGEIEKRCGTGCREYTELAVADRRLCQGLSKECENPGSTGSRGLRRSSLRRPVGRQ